jgi:hypothetical protein
MKNNPVAKHQHKYNKSKVETDKKKEANKVRSDLTPEECLDEMVKLNQERGLYDS